MRMVGEDEGGRVASLPLERQIEGFFRFGSAQGQNDDVKRANATATATATATAID